MLFVRGISDVSIEHRRRTTTAQLIVSLVRAEPRQRDCETVGIPPLMSRKTLGILDGGRGGAVDRARRRRGITGVDKGGA